MKCSSLMSLLCLSGTKIRSDHDLCHVQMNNTVPYRARNNVYFCTNINQHADFPMRDFFLLKIVNDVYLKV